MDNNLKVTYVLVKDLIPAPYNPRRFPKEAREQLKKSIERFGLVDPIVVNNSPKRKNIIIGGNFRCAVAKEMGLEKVPVVFIDIPSLQKEKELNLRLNKNTGEFDLKLLAEFDEAFLADTGWNSEELDEIFAVDNPEQFDLEKELNKLKIDKIRAKKGDRYQLGDHVLMVGDSTIEEDTLKLMDGTKADMVLTDPPYILDYLRGKKKNGKATEGFGAKRNRRYLDTDVLPENFTELWMASIAKIAKKDFSIIVYENWKNLRIIWGEMEKYWKVKNMIVWHLPNRTQGFAADNKLFSKHDIAMVGGSENTKINLRDESELLQNEYETALYAISGKPHWEKYGKGKKICPTDFIEYKASDEKSSGQGIIFGTKPIEILIPYLKILTKRGDIVVEPFGGSGSTLIAAHKMNRVCYIMEKSPVYAEVIMKRFQNESGIKAIKIT